MKVIKSAGARNVVSLPAHQQEAEPLLIDRLVEANRRAIEQRTKKREERAFKVKVLIVCAVVGAWIGYLVGR